MKEFKIEIPGPLVFLLIIFLALIALNVMDNPNPAPCHCSTPEGIDPQ